MFKILVSRGCAISNYDSTKKKKGLVILAHPQMVDSIFAISFIKGNICFEFLYVSLADKAPGKLLKDLIISFLR